VPDVPHFAHPFSVAGGLVAETEQDSVEEIEDCVEACLRTPVGTRIDEPDYGVPDETFIQLSPNPSVEVYLNAVEEAEPRASLIGEGAVEDMTKRITISAEQPGA
jgi:phage baseplate assembly protein W